MNSFYRKSWSKEPDNATAGIEFGRHGSGKVNETLEAKWRWIAKVVSFQIQVLTFEVQFSFYHPNDWRFWVLK